MIDFASLRSMLAGAVLAHSIADGVHAHGTGPEHELIPAEQCQEVIACRPSNCRRGGDALSGTDLEPLRHQGDERLVRTDEWAYLPANATPPARLYLKPDDLWEANDVSQAHPDVCEELAALRLQSQ